MSFACPDFPNAAMTTSALVARAAQATEAAKMEMDAVADTDRMELDTPEVEAAKKELDTVTEAAGMKLATPTKAAPINLDTVETAVMVEPERATVTTTNGVSPTTVLLVVSAKPVPNCEQQSGIEKRLLCTQL